MLWVLQVACCYEGGSTSPQHAHEPSTTHDPSEAQSNMDVLGGPCGFQAAEAGLAAAGAWPGTPQPALSSPMRVAEGHCNCKVCLPASLQSHARCSHGHAAAFAADYHHQVMQPWHLQVSPSLSRHPMQYLPLAFVVARGNADISLDSQYGLARAGCQA